MKKEAKLPYIMLAVLLALTAITALVSVQIWALSSDLKKISMHGVTSGKNEVQQVLEEITPSGVPDYGADAGVSYDSVEESLRTLVTYHQTISLEGDELQRYVTIATSKGTSCGFCCEIGESGFGRSDGKLACGCSHNVALSGLTKWLIKNTGYTNEQIRSEIQKWKTLFFPREALKAELRRRNMSLESAGIPSMVGGC